MSMPSANLPETTTYTPLESDGPETSEILAHRGKFALTATLGRGQTGIVYKAWDTILQRYVALKILADTKQKDNFGKKDSAMQSQEENYPTACYIRETGCNPDGWAVLNFDKGLSLPWHP